MAYQYTPDSLDRLTDLLDERIGFLIDVNNSSRLTPSVVDWMNRASEFLQNVSVAESKKERRDLLHLGQTLLKEEQLRTLDYADTHSGLNESDIAFMNESAVLMRKVRDREVSVREPSEDELQRLESMRQMEEFYGSPEGQDWEAYEQEELARDEDEEEICQNLE